MGATGSITAITAKLVNTAITAIMAITAKLYPALVYVLAQPAPG